MKLSYNLSIDDEHAVKQFTQSMIKNSVEIFRAMRELQNQVQQHNVIILFSFIIFSSLIYIKLNSQSFIIITQIIAQILNNQSSFIIHLFANSVTVFIVLDSKSFSTYLNMKETKID